MIEPIDIVLLTHNRLEYLIRTVEALYERTPEPFRLTLVDNASDSDVRNWIAANRQRFHQVILLPVNEHIAAFQRGIEATTSNPVVLGEPDLVVPALRPSWLAQLRALMDRHGDFGLLSLGLDPVNRPPVRGPESVDESALVDQEIVDADTGIWFQMIRREALREPYIKDKAACMAIRAAGYRVGWAPAIRAFHLGWDDYQRNPQHLAYKQEIRTRAGSEGVMSPYPLYAAFDLIPPPPLLEELANAAPVAAELHTAGVPSDAVLELFWGDWPVLGGVVDGVTTVRGPAERHLPAADRSLGAIVLVDPPPESAEPMLREALRLAAALVVVVGPLTTFGGRAADELAPAGWLGTERQSIGDVPLELARAGNRLPIMQTSARFGTLQRKQEWLSFFASGAFGASHRRLFVFTARKQGPIPAVPDLHALDRWEPPPRAPEPEPSRPGLLGRIRRGAVTWLRARRRGA